MRVRYVSPALSIIGTRAKLQCARKAIALPGEYHCHCVRAAMNIVSLWTANGSAIRTQRNPSLMITAAQTRYWWFNRTEARESFSPVQPRATDGRPSHPSFGDDDRVNPDSDENSDSEGEE